MSVVSLPSVRELLRPDPGFVLIDTDLARADAQIVAWEAGAERLKAIFHSGADVHLANAQSVWGQSAGRVERQLAKTLVHAVNYGAKARTLASQVGISIASAEDFQHRWFITHPEIPRWHQRVDLQLKLSRQVRNVWGFRRFYFDRLDNILPQALAWIGQSSVSVTINKAMLRIHRELPQVQLLLQVHDSLLMQAPEYLCPQIFGEVLDKMQIVVPFSDPLIIPATLKYSRHSWGQMTSWKPGEEMQRAA